MFPAGAPCIFVVGHIYCGIAGFFDFNAEGLKQDLLCWEYCIETACDTEMIPCGYTACGPEPPGASFVWTASASHFTYI